MSLASRCMVLAAAAAAATPVQAAEHAVPQFGPNPAVAWVMISGGLLPPESGPGPVAQDPAHPLIGNDEFRVSGRQPTMPFADLSNPILQPWTRDALRKRNDLVLAGKAESVGMDCRPNGGALHLARSNVQPNFIVQAPDRVVLIGQEDNQFRHVYLGVGHSRNVKPSWSGESVGHYEGDELVVDTIGLAAGPPVDKYFTPHTEQMHMIERIRLVSGGDRLEVRLHVEDPGAFTVPWNAVIRYQRVEPGRAERVFPPGVNSGATPAGPLSEKRCAENPFSYFGKDTPPVPQAARSDF